MNRKHVALIAACAALTACNGNRGYTPVAGGSLGAYRIGSIARPHTACPESSKKGVDLVLTDDSGLATKDLGVYFTSSIPGNLGNYQFLGSGATMVEFKPGNEATRFPLMQCFPGSLGKAGAKFKFPLLPGGRVWIAFGDLPIKGSTTGQFTGPTGWAKGQPGDDVPWDTVELSANNPGIFVNVTRVDMLGLPLQLKVLPLDKTSPGSFQEVGEKPGTLDNTIRALRSNPPFGQTVVVVPGTKVPRIINPSHVASLPNIFNADKYFKGGFINKVAAYYQNTKNISYGTSYKGAYCPGSWSGSGNGSNFTFKQNGTSYTYPVSLLTTNYIFADDPSPKYNAATCQYLLVKILLQELNRGVAMQLGHPVTKVSSFYPKGTVNNQYACVLHNNALHNATYAFAFDDAQNQASVIQNSDPTTVRITIERIPKTLPTAAPKTNVCTPNY